MLRFSSAKALSRRAGGWKSELNNEREPPDAASIWDSDDASPRGDKGVEHVVSVCDAHKSYGRVLALRGATLHVLRGEILCLLGPNGAGKTTLVEVLEGYRQCDAGRIEVLGEDPARPSRIWRGRIGIVSQQGDVEPELTVREQVRRYAGYYGRSLPVDDVIDLVALGSKANARCHRLSGGEGRRLDIALGLVGDPELLFLDEPTTGLDPEARQTTWALVDELRSRGTSILLTTHYMAEAQALADRIAMIVGGRIVANGTTDEISKLSTRGVSVRFRLPPAAWAQFPDALLRHADRDGDLVEVSGVDEIAYLQSALSWSQESGWRLRDLEVRRPSLDDVYFALVRNDDAPQPRRHDAIQ